MRLKFGSPDVSQICNFIFFEQAAIIFAWKSTPIVGVNIGLEYCLLDPYLNVVGV